MDLSAITATEAVRRLSAGDISSTELLDAQIAVVEARNDELNAVVTAEVDAARIAAAMADKRRARGEDLGPLGGLPVTLKDSYETVGLTTACGSPEYADYVPETDSDAAQAIRTSGGIIFGKTNTPLMTGDHQTYNEVYGLTRNPWNPERTAGGSSGGAAVAVATGMSLLEFGSDIGGSLRQPAHMNGVFGFKPTHGVLSLRGHIPGPPGTLAPRDLGVGGPLGRSIDDLELMFRATLTVGAFSGIPGAKLPASDGPLSVADLRLAMWSDDPMATVSAACKQAVERIGAELDTAGAGVHADLRPSMPTDKLHITYLGLLWAVTAAGFPDPVYNGLAKAAREAAFDDMSAVVPRLMTSSHKTWLKNNEIRHKAMASWERLFETVDAVIMPVAPTPAFPHDIESQYPTRLVDVDGTDRPYVDTLFWAGLATMPGLPSVVVPTGAVDGLPVGLQIIGPRYSDFRLLDIARTISNVTSARFVAPGSD
ncbi:MAG: amidase [Acidimicrobiales bacterium]|nr:amidase [Acidimicrobiales bacterium]